MCIQVLVLCLQRMQDGVAVSALPHHQRAALNAATTALDNASKLAHKMVHAMEHSGQQRSYLTKMVDTVRAIEPGATVLLPCASGGMPILFAVKRDLPPDHDTCSFTVVNCDHRAMAFHRSSAQPPKMKLESALEFVGVPLARLADEAFWTVCWFCSLLPEYDFISDQKRAKEIEVK